MLGGFRFFWGNLGVFAGVWVLAGGGIFFGEGGGVEFGGICHIEHSEKSIEFKARFNFMDTSLSCESSV